MQSLNEDRALWNPVMEEKGFSSNDASCCWYLSCCWLGPEEP